MQQNIEAFGGDPSRVTIFGQSAGAYNICALLTSPLAEGLFHRAIMHSGVCSLHDLPRAEAFADEVADEFGCDGDIRACLEGLPTDALVNAEAAKPNDIGDFSVYPHVDGYVAPKQPLLAVAAGENHQVPFMIGSTEDEYSHRYHTGDFNESFYQQRLLGIFGPEKAPLVAAAYPSAEYGSPPQALSAMFTDRNLTCTLRRIASMVSSGQTDPVWRYHFRRVLSTPARIGEGAYHASDLLYMFQHMSGEHFEADDDDRAVQRSMLEMWTRFAAAGDPNDSAAPQWPRYDAVTDPYFILDSPAGSDTGLRVDKCAFWNSLLP